MRSVVLLVLGACSFGVPAGAAADRDASADAAPAPACFESRCKRITIAVDHTKVTGGPHAAFPLYVDVTDPALDRDAVFTTADGASVLPFEREAAVQQGHLLAWVQLPALSSLTDTTIQLYFGDPTATDKANPAATWDAGYQAVWHLTEQGGGPAAIVDSTINANAGTDTNGLQLGVGGKLGRGIRFDGIDDCLVIPRSTSLESTAGIATLSMWVNWTRSVPIDYERLLMSANTFVGDGSGMEWGNNSGGVYYYYPAAAGGNNYASIDEPFVAGTWHHVALTQHFPTQAVQIYVDGTERVKTIDGTPGMWTTLSGLADWYWGGMPPNAQFLGMMDEIRVSNVLRSANWIATEVANQGSPSTFYRTSASPP